MITNSDSSVWVRPVPSLAARVAELAECERLATHDRRRDRSAFALEVTVSLLLGLYLIGYGFHTTDERIGGIAFLAGIALGQVGILVALLRAHGRAVGRGDL